MDEIIVTPPSPPLDEIDRQVIDALRRDGRAAFAQIAESLNVSPGMIRLRYNRLVELGYLKVVAVTNPLMMGKRTMAMIGVRTEGSKMLEVASRLSAFDEVVYVVVVSGRYDLMIEVFCRDHEDLLNFLTEKLAKVDGVRETESFMYLKIAKEIYF
ncbi:MAG: Lrp/AsnC family transcriptional regulator [Chloroflexota bacterium]|nr:Lrp/AsnC family transcriptional regulator [Chloroflexota bacterium]MBI5701948.1 Lrp/AsnC family transcriptional regulator [Chloroflexota bacterium]